MAHEPDMFTGTDPLDLGISLTTGFLRSATHPSAVGTAVGSFAV